MATVRPALPEDVPALQALIIDSARALSKPYYTEAEISVAIADVFGVDSELLEDQTYYAVTQADLYVACGGWSKRKTLFGGDGYDRRESGYLDPQKDAAKIRAFFVAPHAARRGLGSLLLHHCEQQARAAGFTRAEMMATLPGVPLYERYGYSKQEPYIHIGRDGTRLAFVKMGKSLIA